MTNVNANGPATSKARPFIQAANNYMTTLAALSSPASSGEPIDKAQLTLVNHAVKGALDAGHIRQFGHAYAATPAIDQLMSHARAMQDKGTQTVLKLASKDPVDTKARRPSRTWLDTALTCSKRRSIGGGEHAIGRDGSSTRVFDRSLDSIASVTVSHRRTINGEGGSSPSSPSSFRMLKSLENSVEGSDTTSWFDTFPLMLEP